jgi:hypothetical protein
MTKEENEFLERLLLRAEEKEHPSTFALLKFLVDKVSSIEHDVSRCRKN